MNRLLDRKIAEAGQRVEQFVQHSRATLLVVVSEVASGTRQIELSEFAEYSARLQHHMAAYNALVALRTELGE